VAFFLLVCLLAGTAALFTFMYLNPHRWVSINPFFKEEYAVDWSVIEPWDLIVYGTEPEGIAAAVAAARQGLKTLLLGPDDGLGGLFTLGWLNSLDMSWDISSGEPVLLTGGIFEEWWDKLWRPLSFQVDAAYMAFLEMVSEEANLTLRLGDTLLTTALEPQGVRSELLVTTKFLSSSGVEYRTTAPFFIDATADGDLMARTNAPYTFGWADVGRPEVFMAPTLVFEMEHVNWDEVVAYARGLADPRYGASGDSAWAYWEIVAAYQPTDPQTYLRGLNLGRQDAATGDRQDATVLINALLIFEVDPLDTASLAEARRRGEAEARQVAAFLQQVAPGFVQATFSRVAPKLYIRESRHLISMYNLTLGDIISERHFWDEIAQGAYPVDLQAVSTDERERTLYAPQRGYGIPLRSLIPQWGPSNLFVVGRSAGYTSEAHGSARVVPVGMAEGEAAAIAVAIALDRGITNLRHLATDAAVVAAIQAEIRDRGGYIRPPE